MMIHDSFVQEVGAGPRTEFVPGCGKLESLHKRSSMFLAMSGEFPRASYECWGRLKQLHTSLWLFQIWDSICGRPHRHILFDDRSVLAKRDSPRLKSINQTTEQRFYMKQSEVDMISTISHQVVFSQVRRPCRQEQRRA